MPAMTPVQVHESFERAFNDRDIDALMELYEPDAVLIPQPGQTAAGHAQIREALNGFLALNGPINMTNLGAVDGPDVSLVVGRWTLEGTGPDGQPIHLGGLAADVVHKGTDGAWRFAIDNPYSDAIIGEG